jgi:hypothetical protein
MLGHQGPDHVDHGAGAYNMPNAGHSEPTARLGGVTGASRLANRWRASWRPVRRWLTPL